MLLLKFKSTVRVPKSTIIAVAFLNAAHVLGLDGTLLVTSGNDSTHGPHSKHATDAALDFRTKPLPLITKRALVVVLKERLGRDYDCLLEDLGGPNEHLHVEFDPR